jgi:hypothetical protein
MLLAGHPDDDVKDPQEGESGRLVNAGPDVLEAGSDLSIS